MKTLKNIVFHQKYLLPFAFLLMATVFCGCNGNSAPNCSEVVPTENGISVTTTIPTLPVLQSSESNAIADGYEILDGTWVVGGVYYEKYLIDISDNGTLMDLYDTTYLWFYEDGTFLYYNFYYRRGLYDKKDENSFILKTDTVFTYEMTESGLEEKVIESSSKTSYLVTVLDSNTIQFDDLDSATGKASADSFPLLFVRDSEESPYIQANKTPLNGSSDSNTQKKTETQKESPSTTKQDTTDTSSNSSTSVSSGKRNALRSAKDYLAVMPFSYSGLVEQLEYEGYSNSEATYAADNCGADWYEQAVKSAKQYLEVMAFSRSGLIDQLEYEGYTHDQAVYGVDKAY